MSYRTTSRGLRASTRNNRTKNRRRIVERLDALTKSNSQKRTHLHYNLDPLSISFLKLHKRIKYLLLLFLLLLVLLLLLLQLRLRAFMMKLATNFFAFALAATTIQCMISFASGVDTDSSSDVQKRALRFRKPDEEWSYSSPTPKPTPCPHPPTPAPTPPPTPPPTPCPTPPPTPCPHPPSPTTPKPTPNNGIDDSGDSGDGPCPSEDDIWFLYEGLAGAVCETMSFFVHNPSQYSDINYSYSLAGDGSNIPQHENIGLVTNSVINQPEAGNYIFVAKVQVPGCSATYRTCLLDCVPGGPPRSVNDPPYCEYV